MTNEELARGYLRQARYRLGEVERALSDGEWAIAIRRSQECVEQALKAALRFVGLEPPKWHDVSEVLLRYPERFPPWFRERLDDLALISRRRKEHRELSFYGNEVEGIPPDALYTLEDAQQARDDAQVVYRLCHRLIEGR